ncbi:hypothetical protein GWI33_020624 [Rhynchophorus ferrugineus]|uniref:BHLH domain-containing protein n=1 Tax=Rhynchophorus ferrugineus TaxID=354439 RepID=A0A834M329_RHYFE|nr:hypothetical protein GWI33_020624 [Rhynchophorus ferrugineus]
MIDKLIDQYYEAVPPLLDEQMTGSSPIHNFLNDDDERGLSQSDYLLSDDHWKKFELDFPELSQIDDIIKDFNPDCTFDELFNVLDKDDKKEVFLNDHDCMWAGHCISREHSEERRSSFGCVIPKPPVIKTADISPSAIIKTGTSVQNQQSLLKPSVKANNLTTVSFPSNGNNGNIIHTPQTPPESDDEENKCRNFRWKVPDCEFEEDHDLREYFKEKDVEIKEEPIDIKEEPLDVKTEDETESEQDDAYSEYQKLRIRTQLAAENDHSYHKDMNEAMRLNNYGLDTPSESEEEEEIDVVSVNDKFGSTATRMTLSLPNYPSNSDRHQWQRHVATAISRKHDGGTGLKTMGPISRTNSSASSSASTSSSRSGRGSKKGRASRTNLGYKRRRFNGDGSVREHTDKRHLHNDMERQRRVDLRIAFDNLKAVVPEVSGTKKIAKVNILLQAAEYCYGLTKTNTNYTKQLDELRKRQVWLRQRVSQLRRNLAARR